MEIRRCDKCKIEVDLADIQKFEYHSGEIKALTLKLPTMASREEQKTILRQEFHGALDDRDVFANNIARKEIDLCENCVVEFASMVKTWLANVDIGVP
jgi:arabinogalactan endo-1,4-beta-galactosidase